jgi:hypothetical protein
MANTSQVRLKKRDELIVTMAARSNNGDFTTSNGCVHLCEAESLLKPKEIVKDMAIAT